MTRTIFFSLVLKVCIICTYIDGKPNLAFFTVDIAFSTIEETYNIHKPEMNIIDLIVYAAGLIGLFLGLSVIVLVDIFEYIHEFVKARNAADTSKI